MILLIGEINDRHYCAGVCKDAEAMKVAFKHYDIDRLALPERPARVDTLGPNYNVDFTPEMAYAATAIWEIIYPETAEQEKECHIDIGHGITAYQIPEGTNCIHGFDMD
jgi:hypothetical protein